MKDVGLVTGGPSKDVGLVTAGPSKDVGLVTGGLSLGSGGRQSSQHDSLLGCWFAGLP